MKAHGTLQLVGLFTVGLFGLCPFASTAVADEYVTVNKRRAHPTHILASYKAGVAHPAGQTRLQSLGFNLQRRYALTPRLVVMEGGKGALAPEVAGEDPTGRRQRLLSRIQTLRESGLFEYVEPDYIVEVGLSPTDAAFVDDRLWALRNSGQEGGTPGIDIRATQAWDVTTGSPDQVVAVIDTGVRYTHRDLASQMWRHPGEIPGNGLDDDGDGYVDNVFGINAITGSGDPMDDHNHGTHVAGTIGAAPNNGYSHVGVAWNVRIMACKFLDADGFGATSDAIECINFAVRNGATILNNSWGGGGFSQALYDAISAASAAGVLFVAAAGNEGANIDAEPRYPAGYDLDNVVSVAATDRNDQLARFSNFGKISVDLAAPGLEIFSSTAEDDEAYGVFSGTSMATPHVSGAAALILAQDPDCSLAELRERLLASVMPVGELESRSVSGGRLDAYHALTIQPDGTLEVQIRPSHPAPWRAGDQITLRVRVTDLGNVTNATVSAQASSGPIHSFRDDGLRPDERAGDGVYSAELTVPQETGALQLAFSVSAPGKDALTIIRTFPVAFPPVNDLFADRIVLSSGTTHFTSSNVGANREPGEPAHEASEGGRSVWWSWTPSESGAVKVDTFESTFDTILAIYTGNSLDSVALLASNDDDGAKRSSCLTIQVQAGTTYQIMVDGYARPGQTAAAGRVELHITPVRAIINGSFESGDFSGWVIDDLAEPFLPVSVAQDGYSPGFGLFASEATDGDFSATHGFDGAGPGTVRIAQDTTVPADAPLLRFDYRAGWMMESYGASQARTFSLTIEPTGGGPVLGSTLLLTAAPGEVNADFGARRAAVDLSAYANTAVRISFDAVVPESFTGPGHLQLDNVSFLEPAFPGTILLNVAEGFRIIANPFAGQSPLDELLILHREADGARIYQFDPLTKNWESLIYRHGHGWMGGSTELQAGEGVFLHLPKPTQVQWRGLITPGTVTRPILGNNRFSVVASATPKSAPIGYEADKTGPASGLEFPAKTGDRIYLYDGATGLYDTASYEEGKGWTSQAGPDGPIIEAGTGFWVRKSGPDTVWEQAYP